MNLQLLLYGCRMSTVAAPIDMNALGRLGKALADDTRRRILVSLLDSPSFSGELADELGLTKANVSNHLTCLRGCRLVTATPDGRRVRYELAHPRLAHALRDLAGLDLGPGDPTCAVSEP